MTMTKDKAKDEAEGKHSAYYVTLFKTAGHETWRMHTGKTPETFAEEVKRNMKKVEITDRKVHRVDRITGAITEYK